ncbi:MAG TPA: hypothetical protein VGF59_15125 [Bryobacteraceae bacterium]|jgi:hypothetical protein
MFPLLLVTSALLPQVWSEPATEADEIDRLVRQMGSDSFAERQKASKALEAIGEPALATLRKAARDSDAEIRRRATELVRTIEARRAAQGRARALAVVRRRDGRCEIDKDSPGKPVVRVILFKTRVTDDEVCQLKWLSRLQYLDLAGTDVTDACLDGLRELRELQFLDVSGTKVTGAGLIDLRKRMPKLRIKRRYIDDNYDVPRTTK